MWSRQEINNILDACKTLEIKPGCSIDEVNKAFRHQASLHHPDKNPSGEERFKKINNARDLLTSPSIRAFLEQYLIDKEIFDTNNTMKNKQQKTSTFHHFFNQPTWFHPESMPGNNEQELQSDWQLDDFSLEHDTFRFKGVSGEFNGNHVTFFHYASSSPFISFTFKYDPHFYDYIYKKISSELYYNLWTSNSLAEGALKFGLPRDNNNYIKILSIIFDEYKLPKKYLEMILDKKLKYEFIPKQEKISRNNSYF